VPPLREREFDIDLLTEHFNHCLAERHGVASRRFGPDVLALLRGYPWPGNVRELRNVVEGLLLTSAEDEVSCDELPEELLAAVHNAAGVGPAVSAASGRTTSLQESERLAIVRAVQTVHGNLAQAARMLGISRSTLYRKVERYRLEGIVRVGDDTDRAADPAH
jgi:DNA-binding NtrC family response regulator